MSVKTTSKRVYHQLLTDSLIILAVPDNPQPMMVTYVRPLNGFLLMACITFGTRFCAEMVEVLDFSTDAVASSKESCHGLSFLYQFRIYNTKLSFCVNTYLIQPIFSFWGWGSSD